MTIYLHDNGKRMDKCNVNKIFNNLLDDGEISFYLYHNHRVTIRRLTGVNECDVMEFSNDQYYQPFFGIVNRYNLTFMSHVKYRKRDMRITFNI
jgi:hypothetical protein